MPTPSEEAEVPVAGTPLDIKKHHCWIIMEYQRLIQYCEWVYFSDIDVFIRCMKYDFRNSKSVWYMTWACSKSVIILNNGILVLNNNIQISHENMWISFRGIFVSQDMLCSCGDHCPSMAAAKNFLVNSLLDSVVSNVWVCLPPN